MFKVNISQVGTQAPVLSVKQSGAVEACWAHNPEVRGSKPRSASILFLFISMQCSTLTFLRRTAEIIENYVHMSISIKLCMHAHTGSELCYLSIYDNYLLAISFDIDFLV